MLRIGSASGILPAFFLSGAAHPALAQEDGIIDPTQTRDWVPGMVAHAQQMRKFKDVDKGSQPTPTTIPKLEIDNDPTGRVGSYHLGASTTTSDNPFFQSLGTNGRTCFTCHQPQNGWSVSAASVRARFDASAGEDPIFRLIDGATCPTDDVLTLAAKQRAYKLLLDKGLIRIFIPIPENAEFTVTVVNDPYGCNPKTVPVGPTAVLSMYRRPLPATNLDFLTTIMWDGREPSLQTLAPSRQSRNR